MGGQRGEDGDEKPGRLQVEVRGVGIFPVDKKVGGAEKGKEKTPADGAVVVAEQAVVLAGLADEDYHRPLVDGDEDRLGREQEASRERPEDERAEQEIAERIPGELKAPPQEKETCC